MHKPKSLDQHRQEFAMVFAQKANQMERTLVERRSDHNLYENKPQNSISESDLEVVFEHTKKVDTLWGHALILENE